MALNDYASALVTGASSGIGAALVRSLRAHGLSVHAIELQPTEQVFGGVSLAPAD